MLTYVQNVQNININIQLVLFAGSDDFSHKGFLPFQFETDFSINILYILNYFTDLR